MNNVETNRTRSLSGLINEIKEELKEFAEVRLELFRREVRDKIAHWKTAAPLAVGALVLLATAYLLITLAVVALVALLIGDTQFRWFFAFLIVGVSWALVGAVLGYMAKRDFLATPLSPQKTVEVLKGDKIWLQKEARNQI